MLNNSNANGYQCYAKQCSCLAILMLSYANTGNVNANEKWHKC